MERGIDFLTRVHEALVTRGRVRDYIEDALKVACNLPEGMTLREVSEAFVRWYYGEPAGELDGPVRHILNGGIGNKPEQVKIAPAAALSAASFSSGELHRPDKSGGR